mmetsp:Transcript_18340/g.31057  ORF Transcript_18340/g.31057 Transcript_18340/m.31057 type:complete len:203 (-) Transcript_18340:1080-1688(-)
MDNTSALSACTAVAALPSLGCTTELCVGHLSKAGLFVKAADFVRCLLEQTHCRLIICCGFGKFCLLCSTHISCLGELSFNISNLGFLPFNLSSYLLQLCFVEGNSCLQIFHGSFKLLLRSLIFGLVGHACVLLLQIISILLLQECNHVINLCHDCVKGTRGVLLMQQCHQRSHPSILGGAVGRGQGFSGTLTLGELQKAKGR